MSRVRRAVRGDERVQFETGPSVRAEETLVLIHAERRVGLLTASDIHQQSLPTTQTDGAHVLLTQTKLDQLK